MFIFYLDNFNSKDISVILSIKELNSESSAKLVTS